MREPAACRSSRCAAYALAKLSEEERRNAATASAATTLRLLAADSVGALYHYMPLVRTAGDYRDHHAEVELTDVDEALQRRSAAEETGGNSTLRQ